jgi:hypothetical protein
METKDFPIGKRILFTINGSLTKAKVIKVTGNYVRLEYEDGFRFWCEVNNIKDWILQEEVLDE